MRTPCRGPQPTKMRLYQLQPAHWILRVGSLETALHFCETNFGMEVLQHEECRGGDGDSDATKHGRGYGGGAWSETSIGSRTETNTGTCTPPSTASFSLILACTVVLARTRACALRYKKSLLTKVRYRKSPPRSYSPTRTYRSRWVRWTCLGAPGAHRRLRRRRYAGLQQRSAVLPRGFQRRSHHLRRRWCSCSSSRTSFGSARRASSRPL